MQIDVIDTYGEFEKLRPDWDAVYQADPEAQFFLSWTWLSRVFLQGPSGWFVLAAKLMNGGNDYVAFFPLRLKTRMSKSRRVFCNDIHMAGRSFWADYTGFICHPDHEQQAIPLMASKLKQMNWTRLYLKNVWASDERLALFTDQFSKAAFDIENRQRNSKRDNTDLLVCPYLELPDDFDTYLTENMSANTRQKVRRFLRKIENSEDFEITISVPETHERDLDILTGFWQQKWAQRKGEEVERLAKTYRTILREGLKSNIVYMPVLWRGSTPLGVLGSFVDWQKKVLLFFVAGRNESCNNPPPGLVLHAHSIRWAIDNGLEVYDLLRGDEDYKYSFGAKERRIKYQILSTRSGTNLNGTLDPRCIDDALHRSTRYLQSGRAKEAEIGFRQILDVSPNNTTALRRYGRLLYQNNDFAAAKEIYRRLVDSEPDNAAGWVRLGRSQLALNDFKAAEDAFRKARELYPPRSIDVSYYLGRAFQGLGKAAEAATEFRAVLDLVPSNHREAIHQQKARDLLRQSLQS